MASGLIGIQVLRKELWVRVPCPPLCINLHGLAQSRSSQGLVAFFRILLCIGIASRAILMRRFAPCAFPCARSAG